MEDTTKAPDGDLTEVSGDAVEKANTARKMREIPGGFPYMTSHGTLRKVLDRIIEAQRPDKFNPDYVENVLKMKGGTARATITILKKMGFLSSDGSPTELYAKFKTDSGRSAAALQGLRNAFSEIFRRSDYAHAADENKLRDLIVEITGLQKNDPVANAIRGTFNVMRSYISADAGSIKEAPEQGGITEEEAAPRPERPQAVRLDDTRGINLAYNINVVLPETSDLTVLNAIFRSIKENLLR
jgi:hypothetical protein